MKQLFLVLIFILTIVGCSKEEAQPAPYQNISSADIKVMSSSNLSKAPEEDVTYFHKDEVINVHIGADVVDQHFHLEVLATIESETNFKFNIVTDRLRHVDIKINYNEDPALETIDYVVINDAEIDVVYNTWTNASWLGHEHTPVFNDYLFATDGNSIELIARLWAYRLGQKSAATQPIDFDYLRTID